MDTCKESNVFYVVDPSCVNQMKGMFLHITQDASMRQRSLAEGGTETVSKDGIEQSWKKKRLGVKNRKRLRRFRSSPGGEAYADLEDIRWEIDMLLSYNLSPEYIVVSHNILNHITGKSDTWEIDMCWGYPVIPIETPNFFEVVVKPQDRSRAFLLRRQRIWKKDE